MGSTSGACGTVHFWNPPHVGSNLRDRHWNFEFESVWTAPKLRGESNLKYLEHQFGTGI